MDRLRIATAWLGGCSGCHMSFLDLDEWLVDLAGKVQLVYRICWNKSIKSLMKLFPMAHWINISTIRQGLLPVSSTDN